MNKQQIHGAFGLVVVLCLVISIMANLVALSHGIVDKELIAFSFLTFLLFILYSCFGSMFWRDKECVKKSL